MTRDLYDALGVPPDASPDDIKAAHRKAVKRHHPDAGGDPDAFRAIQKAYDVLSDAEARDRYDRTGSTDTSDSKTRREAAARERFGAMLIDAVQHSETIAMHRDWLAQAKRQVAQDRLHIEGERATLLSKKAVAEKLVIRFKPKTERNLPKDILNHVSREIDRLAAELEDKLAILASVDELMSEYEFEVEPAPASTRAGMTAAWVGPQGKSGTNSTYSRFPWET